MSIVSESIPSSPAGDHVDVNSLIQECQPDRIALKNELQPLFRSLWTEGLKAVEAALPEFRVPGTADQRLHTRLRGMILNAGNAQVRELEKILGNYYLKQLFQREVVERVAVNTPFRLPQS